MDTDELMRLDGMDPWSTDCIWLVSGSTELLRFADGTSRINVRLTSELNLRLTDPRSHFIHVGKQA